MMILPSMLLDAAQQAGMKCPELDENETFDKEQFPHFHLFCNAQLNRPITWGNHWNNAKIIAAIPENQVKTITWDDLDILGFDA